MSDMESVDPETGEELRRIKVLGREFVMPRSRFVRIVIGCLLVLGGILGFLPVLGFWMIPLGLLVLSYEFAMVRRWRRRTELWWAERRGRRRRSRTAAAAGSTDTPDDEGGDGPDRQRRSS